MKDILKVWLKGVKLHESTISMFLGAVVVVVVGILLYNFFTGIEEEPPQEVVEETQEYTLQLEEEEGQLIPLGLPVEHTVSAGEHLWGISERYYGNGYNWTDIAQENALVNPGLILVGQKLTIPRVGLRLVTGEETPRVSEMGGTITGEEYTVIKGDTLWGIAVRAYQDGYQWSRIYQANRNVVANPDLIEVGMELAIPR